MERLLKRREVEQVTGLSRASIYRLMAIREFPCPVKVGLRSVAWRSSDVETWFANRPKAGPTI